MVIKENNYQDDKMTKNAIKDFKEVGDMISELLANYSEFVSVRGKGILNDEEIGEIGETMDMLYDVCRYLRDYTDPNFDW